MECHQGKSESRQAAILARLDLGAAPLAPIPDFIFGGFVEHIGNLITHSLWSEVLDDRKFFRAVDSTALDEPAGPMARALAVRKWFPIGPDSSISMDRDAPYVGEHCPRIRLAESEPRGLSQSGLALGAKDYVGRLVVSAEPGARVSLILRWGPSHGQSLTQTIRAGAEWETIPFSFSCPVETLSASLEIVGLGSGSFKVAAVSLMPSDNLQGFRADTLELMRQMDCRILRLPGGNYVSGYDWKDCIGDPDRRPPVLDPVWGAIQQNDVGVDELLNLCRLIGAEPYWCVNTGFGEPRSGAELVEYVNGHASTQWGGLRAANGHAEPYAVHYWNLGNEMYGHWQLGHMAPAHYAIKHRLFAQAMRRVDPSIYVVVPGGFVDEMTTGQGIVADSGNRLVPFGSARDWAGQMLERCMGSFDALATHAYPPENKRFNLETGKNMDIQQSLAEWARAPADRVATMADCWEEYKRRYPELGQGKIKVFFDEWAYRFVQDHRACLAAARALHELFRHGDFISMAGYTMATAWMDYDRLRSCLSATGLLFQLYNRRFGRLPVAVSGDSPVPPPAYPIGGDQPRINTGSDTWPLDVSAALGPGRRTLTVAVVNASDRAQSLSLAISGAKLTADARCWRFKSGGPDSINRAGHEPAVRVEEAMFDPLAPSLDIAAYDIELYEYGLG